MTTREQIVSILNLHLGDGYGSLPSEISDQILSLISTHFIPRERVEEEIAAVEARHFNHGYSVIKHLSRALLEDRNKE